MAPLAFGCNNIIHNAIGGAPSALLLIPCVMHCVTRDGVRMGALVGMHLAVGDSFVVCAVVTVVP
jgi:hypothetical protein